MALNALHSTAKGLPTDLAGPVGTGTWPSSSTDRLLSGPQASRAGCAPDPPLCCFGMGSGKRPGWVNRATASSLRSAAPQQHLSDLDGVTALYAPQPQTGAGGSTGLAEAKATGRRRAQG